MYIERWYRKVIKHQGRNKKEQKEFEKRASHSQSRQNNLWRLGRTNMWTLKTINPIGLRQFLSITDGIYYCNKIQLTQSCTKQLSSSYESEEESQNNSGVSVVTSSAGAKVLVEGKQ